MRFWIAGPRLFGGLIRPGISFNARPSAPAWGYARQRAPQGGYVYVIEREDTGHVKVGSSGEPQGRRATLQTGSSTRLHIVHTAFAGNAAKDVELTAHDFLDRQRLIGEWFDVPPETAIAAVYAAASRLGVSLGEPGEYDEADAYEIEMARRYRRYNRIRWTIFAIAMGALFYGVVHMGLH